MLTYLNRQDMDWAAEERMCRALGIPFTYKEGQGRPFRFYPLLLRVLLRRPWQVFQACTAVNVYWTCKYYIAELLEEADKIITEENEDMVDHILFLAGQELVSESAEDWPELIGLISQKLVHLRYHNDILKWEAGSFE